jgi:hypothetical protein
VPLAVQGRDHLLDVDGLAVARGDAVMEQNAHAAAAPGTAVA